MAVEGILEILFPREVLHRLGEHIPGRGGELRDGESRPFE